MPVFLARLAEYDLNRSVRLRKNDTLSITALSSEVSLYVSYLLRISFFIYTSCVVDNRLASNQRVVYAIYLSST